QARALVENIEGVSINEMQGAEQCCGFGGLFAVKMAEISAAMLREKVEAIEESEADVIITGDCSCMTQINGGLSRQQSARRALYIADLLAEGLRQRQNEPESK